MTITIFISRQSIFGFFVLIIFDLCGRDIKQEKFHAKAVVKRVALRLMCLHDRPRFRINHGLLRI